VNLAVLQLDPGRLCVRGQGTERNLRHDLVFFEDVLAQDIGAGADEIIVERNLALSLRPGDFRFRIEGQQGSRRVRWVDDVAELAADYGVVAVVAGDRETEIATFLVAVELVAAEEPAPRALIDIAAHGAEVADEGRCDRLRGVYQQGPAAPQFGGVDD